MAVDSIDIDWLSNFDLTSSMAFQGTSSIPISLPAVDRLVAACRVHAKPSGVLANSVETAEAAHPKLRFAGDSPLEGPGSELLVPRADGIRSQVPRRHRRTSGCGLGGDAWSP
jgi:hypothetical protein